MKEIDEENKNMLRLKTQSGVINAKLKEMKDDVKTQEAELSEQKKQIKDKEQSITNAKKQQEEAQKSINELADKIRVLDSQANRWTTDTKVIKAKHLVGSRLYSTQKRA